MTIENPKVEESSYFMMVGDERREVNMDLIDGETPSLKLLSYFISLTFLFIFKLEFNKYDNPFVSPSDTTPKALNVIFENLFF